MNKFVSPYSPNTDSDRVEMLKTLGVSSEKDLFKDIPRKFVDPELNLPNPRSELDLHSELYRISKMNKTPGEIPSFLGAGSYRHFTPSAVKQIVRRGEYMTAYTPYQPEVAQGTLQTGYEFQTMICELTGMEIANSGMYEGASALAEAALMSVRINKRNEIIVLNSVSPLYTEVIKTFVEAPSIKLVTVNSVKDLESKISNNTSCVLVQNPNFFGFLENLENISRIAKKHDSLMVVSSDPISMALFKPPGDYDADIVVSEGQSLGIPPSFGGPYVGIFACKKKYMRQMPGRIVGRTIDSNNRKGFVLTLQTREQHIRREKATSNICTSVALIALSATAYLGALGKNGIRHIAELCYHKAHYAASSIESIPGFSMPLTGIFFNEFIITCPISPKKINSILLENNIIGGYDVSSLINKGMLLSFTELNTKEEIDKLVSILSDIKY